MQPHQQTDTISGYAERSMRDMQAVAAPSLEMFIVTVRDAGKDFANPPEFIDVWAPDVERAHQAVMAVLRNRRDDHASDIVGIMATGSYRYP